MPFPCVFFDGFLSVRAIERDYAERIGERAGVRLHPPRPTPSRDHS